MIQATHTLQSCTHCSTARSLSRQRIKTCLHCQQEFYYGRSDQKYCQESCRVQACKKRKAQREAIATQTLVPAMLPTSLTSLATEPTNPAPTSSPQPPSFLQGVGETVLGNALVTGAKYLLVDQPLKEQLNRIEEKLPAKPLVQTNARLAPLRYLGIRTLQGKSVVLFEDPNSKKRFYADQQGLYLLPLSGH